MEHFPEKVPRATEGWEGTVLASWAAGDAAKGGGAEPLVWHAVSSHHNRPPKRGAKDAGRDAPNEQVRRIEEDGGAVAGEHIGEGRTVLAVSSLPEDDSGAGR